MTSKAIPTVVAAGQHQQLRCIMASRQIMTVQQLCNVSKIIDLWIFFQSTSTYFILYSFKSFIKWLKLSCKIPHVIADVVQAPAAARVAPNVQNTAAQ